ncbi:MULTISPECIES: hypothetical protein [unclassified Cryobacterium]|uniref:hypothetical protein n=1 Tax=unclassified Cryobacterium TaxID=2649013 RepID=UPI00106CB744|nr:MULTISPECIES: hypothetical protein [unclassified Cryobacterium]MDY7529602.1 hypothetical protein [Cryobacterium sp. 10C2]MDY7558254.1 hypothetical protein [Cryobacterium sp. 10C3]MEB0003448.1 hypothetical protein [Cryobacterium sp. RTC2.1]MEB0285346.1 hypothetical protein [Cryobacterium sp. 10S3]MEB0291954.1 hypothetical protein [Cryobacterium sp. 10C2]
MRLAGFSASLHPHGAPRTAGLRTAILAALALIAVLACVLFAHAGADGQDVNVPAAVSPMAMSTSATTSGSASSAFSGTVVSGTVLSGTLAQAVALSASVAVTATAAATGMARTIAASVGQRVLCFEGNSLGGGAMAAMSCSVLLILGSLLLIAGGPSALGLLFAAGGFVVGTFRTIALHLHRPSLTLLSVSRI